MKGSTIKAKYFLMITLVIILFAGCRDEITSKLLKNLKGAIIFSSPSLQGSELTKYDFSHKKTSLSDPALDLKFPISIPNGKGLLCSSKAAIYRVSKEGIEKIFDSNTNVGRVCYLTDEKIAYVSNNNYSDYRITIVDLKSNKSIEIGKDLVKVLTHLTSTKNILMFDSEEGIIYKLQLDEAVLTPTKFITGYYPEVRSDGTKLAYLSPNNYELMVFDLENKKTIQTGIKSITEIAWIKDTNYLIYEQRRTYFALGIIPVSDFIELGIVDYTTGKKYKLLEEPPGSFGRGLAWVDL